MAAVDPVTIRPAVNGDIPALTGLLGLLFAIEADFHIDPGAQRRGLAMLLAHPLGRIVVAVDGGSVIGMCSGQLTISTAEGDYALLVEDLVVAAGFRGTGVGRRLLAAVADWAAAFGARRMQLLADRGNHGALAFYHRLGWRGTELICLRRYHSPEGDRPGALLRS